MISLAKTQIIQKQQNNVPPKHMEVIRLFLDDTLAILALLPYRANQRSPQPVHDEQAYVTRDP